MIQEVRGTKDILPDSIYKWQQIEDVIKKVTESFCYKEIRTPIFESTEVFSRSIGETSDIVNKEMYTFNDRGGNSLTLRPEMTAALVRSAIQNNLTAQGALARLWYFGPFFRYERPQKGRYRQFHQFGAECLSSPNPESDFEIILLADSLIRGLGIQSYTLNLNSLGNENSRNIYKNELVNYFSSKKENLSEESLFRLEKNPLRILDSKDQRDIDVCFNAPKLSNSLDEESIKHFEMVKKLLDSAGISYNLNDNLVRGLDYYSHTVFEFQSNALGAQDSFGGGGRYNKLFSELGGKDTPAVGFAMGVERLIIIMDSQNLFKNDENIDFYIVVGNNIEENFELVSYSNKIGKMLRNLGFSVKNDVRRRSFKAQFNEANTSNAKFVIVVGEDELSNNKISLKNMTLGKQINLLYNDLENISTILETGFNEAQ